MRLPEPLGKNVYRTRSQDFYYLHNGIFNGSSLPGFMIVTPSDVPDEKHGKIAGHFQKRIHSFDEGVVNYITGGGHEPVNRLSTKAIELHHKLKVESRSRPILDVAYYLDRDSDDPTKIRAAIVSTRGYRSDSTDVVVYGSGKPVIAVITNVVDRNGAQAIERNVVVKADELDALQSELVVAIGHQLRETETMFFDDSINGEYVIVKPIRPAHGLGLDQLLTS